MPTIPQIQRRVSPSATGAFQLRQKDTQVASATNQLSGTIQQAAQAIQTIKDKADKIVDTRQMTQAMLDVQKLTSKFHVDMSENTDTANSKNIIEGYQNGVRELLGGVDNNRIKDDLYGRATSMSLSAIGTEELRDVTRNIKAVESNYKASADNLIYLSSLVGDEAAIGLAEEAHLQLFDKYSELAGLSKEQKELELRKTYSLMEKARISGAMTKDPELAKSILENSQHLNDEEKKKVAVDINKHEKFFKDKEKEVVSKLQVQNYEGYISKINAGDFENISLSRIKDEVDGGALNKAQGSLIETVLLRNTSYDGINDSKIATWRAKREGQIGFWQKKKNLDSWLKEGEELYKAGHISRNELLADISIMHNALKDDESLKRMTYAAKADSKLMKRASMVDPIMFPVIANDIIREAREEGVMIMSDEYIDKKLSEKVPDYKNRVAVSGRSNFNSTKDKDGVIKVSVVKDEA
jgi:hypothetical protein